MRKNKGILIIVIFILAVGAVAAGCRLVKNYIKNENGELKQPEAAPKSTAESETKSATESTEESAAESGTEPTTEPTEPAEPTFDAEASYNELVAELQTLKADLQELKDKVNSLLEVPAEEDAFSKQTKNEKNEHKGFMMKCNA